MRPGAFDLSSALAAGYERMAAWSDLLDQINVFPIADDDTGRNLRISLAPLRLFETNHSLTVHRLLTAATGNSGNIAAGFFSGFLPAGPETDFSRAARLGRESAWRAVGRPRSGTMLTAFDALAENGAAPPETMLRALQAAVSSTAETLPEMKRANVVDAGALGVYLFFEGFVAKTSRDPVPLRPLTETFFGRLEIAEGYAAGPSLRYCIDTVVQTEAPDFRHSRIFEDLGDSLVVVPGKEGLKIHLHTDRRSQVRQRLEGLGKVIRWSDEAIEEAQRGAGKTAPAGPVHVMTDAAGSLTRKDAKKLGITLLDSYLVFDDRTAPETLVACDSLYAAMRNGRKVSTAQASVFERRQCYQSVLSRYGRVLYLCVGSAYTGNFPTAAEWKTENGLDGRFTILDTGAASGRLAVAAIATARQAATANAAETVVAFARSAVERSDELLFLDRLKYLAEGGRLSKTKGFFGDLLGKKPVITPTAEGAVKAGIVRNKDEQLAFALHRLEGGFGKSAGGLILLEYSDNRTWVADTVFSAVSQRFAEAEIRITPLSLTSGVHMGPGTWGVAYLPDGSVGKSGRAPHDRIS